MRYEFRAAGRDKRGLQSNFNWLTGAMDPPIVDTVLQPWETGRYVADVPTIAWSKHIVLPRLGLAYRVTDKTVIRTGVRLLLQRAERDHDPVARPEPASQCPRRSRTYPIPPSPI